MADTFKTEPLREPLVAQPRNRLLAALPREDYERLLPNLQTIQVTRKQVLQKQGDAVRSVFFPGRGTCSVVEVMHDELSIEVGMVGVEGASGMCALGHHPIADAETRVQIGDDAMQVMSLQAFQDEMRRGLAFADLIQRYTHGFLRLVMQSCACNGLHAVDERCCRWLLMTHDRIGSNELPVTQDSLAAALGVRRPTVTLTVNALREAGLISLGHRKITIVNRPGLEAAACECYTVIRTYFDRMLPA